MNHQQRREAASAGRMQRETLPVPEVCRGCDFLYPKIGALRGRQCAAFVTCTTGESCGARSSPIPYRPKEERKA